MKHFDIDGISGQVQFGKSGASVKATSSGLDFIQPDGSPATLTAAPGKGDNDVVVTSQLSPIAASVTALATSSATTASALAQQCTSLSADLATLQAIVNKLMPVAPETIDVAPGLAAGTLLGNIKEGHRVSSIQIEVQEAFDNGASLTVGNSSQNDFYMDATHSDLAYVGTYATTPPDSTITDNTVTATLTGSPTTGKATIRLEYAAT